jgi:hypothetical protein
MRFTAPRCRARPGGEKSSWCWWGLHGIDSNCHRSGLESRHSMKPPHIYQRPPQPPGHYCTFWNTRNPEQSTATIRLLYVYMFLHETPLDHFSAAAILDGPVKSCRTLEIWYRSLLEPGSTPLDERELPSGKGFHAASRSSSISSIS